jgi:sodium/hydrogen antiporter
MTLLIAFACSLFLAVVLSGWAKKTILSSAVLFLAAGILVGSGIVPGTAVPKLESLRSVAEVALFSTLFSDGIRTGGFANIRQEWHLAGRALLIGMPLTIFLIALVAHYATGMNWIVALLLGAALSPTDPVFVSAIFQVDAVPRRIKRALNVESGMNDGLALTAVVVLLSAATAKPGNIASVIWQLVLGLLIGIAVPWLGIKIEETRLFEVVGVFQPILAFSLALLVYSICLATGANEFLAAFSAGVTTATLSRRASEAFHPFGEIASELLKLAALLVFGAIMARRLLLPLSWQEYLFLILAIFAVRPFATALSWIGTNVTRKELLTFGWFGPKGFASVVYGILILQAGLSHAAHLVGVAVAISIVVFSSTDIFVGRVFADPEARRQSQPADIQRAA